MRVSIESEVPLLIIVLELVAQLTAFSCSSKSNFLMGDSDIPFSLDHRRSRKYLYWRNPLRPPGVNYPPWDNFEMLRR